MPGDLADDLSVPDDTKLLRRIPPGWIHAGVPESNAFKPDKEPDALGTSVTIWESVEDEENTMRGREDFGLLMVTAGECRQAGLGIVRTPLPDNPNHCELFGPPLTSKRRNLSKSARFVRYPDAVPEDLRKPIVQLDD